MTVAEAKREIDGIDYYLQNHTNDYSEKSHAALMMAIRSLEAWEKVKAEITEYGNLCVEYVIKGNTEKDIGDIVASVLTQEKSQILHIINEHLKGVTKCK